MFCHFAAVTASPPLPSSSPSRFALPSQFLFVSFSDFYYLFIHPSIFHSSILSTHLSSPSFPTKINLIDEDEAEIKEDFLEKRRVAQSLATAIAFIVLFNFS